MPYKDKEQERAARKQNRLDRPEQYRELCNQCNCMLGHSKDTPELLEAGALYLRKYQNV